MTGPSFDRAAAAKLWDFGGVDYMNHGSFGACPRPVRDFQQAERETLLRNPLEYYAENYPRRIAEARSFWAGFLNADPDGLAPMENATSGVNTVMKSLALRGWFRPGDEILLTSHGYNACNNVANEIAALTGAVTVVAKVPFPIESAAQVTEAILNAATPKTRLALIDHLTSETGLIFPIGQVVAGLKARGIETLVDGAHAPAHVPLDLKALDAAFYTGNGHKWLCAAPGCAFLYVREDFRDRIRPLTTSHGANDPNPAQTAFQKTFSWVGTRDPSAWFTPKIAFDTLSSLHPGGLWGLVGDNHRLAMQGYRLLLDALKLQPHAPEDMLGTMATVILPGGDAPRLQNDLRRRDNLSTMLGLLTVSGGKNRLLRISAQAYNHEAQYARLVAALVRGLADEKHGKLLPLAS